MDLVKTILVRVILVPCCGLLISQTALAILHSNNWYPEQALARLLMESPTLFQVEWVRLAIITIASLLLWAAADHFLYRRHKRGGKPAPGASAGKPPLSLRDQNAADFALAAGKLSAAMDGAFYRLLHGSSAPPPKIIGLKSESSSLQQPLVTKRMFTAYDVEQRLRAIDQLLEFLDPKIMMVSATGERLNSAIFGKIVDGTAVSALDQYADSLELVLSEYQIEASRYAKFADIYQAATSCDWALDRVPHTVRLLRAELQDMKGRGQLNIQPQFIVDMLRSNKLLADFQEVSSGKIWTWINDRKNALVEKRGEYETVEVYSLVSQKAEPFPAAKSELPATVIPTEAKSDKQAGRASLRPAATPLISPERFYSRAEKERIVDTMNLIQQGFRAGRNMMWEAEKVSSNPGHNHELDKSIERMKSVYTEVEKLNIDLDKIRNESHSYPVNFAVLLAAKPVYSDEFQRAVYDYSNALTAFRHCITNSGEHRGTLAKVVDSEKRHLSRAKHHFEKWMDECDEHMRTARRSLEK